MTRLLRDTPRRKVVSMTIRRRRRHLRLHRLLSGKALPFRGLITTLNRAAAPMHRGAAARLRKREERGTGKAEPFRRAVGEAPLASHGPVLTGHAGAPADEARLFGPLLGGLLWILCLTAAACGRMRLGALEGLFLLAPLVTIPLGLRLVFRTEGQGIARPLTRFTLLAQPVGALLVVGAFILPVGKWAGALASGWLLVTVGIALCGLVGLVESGIPLLERTCLNLGLVYLPFGASWLVASRMGLNPDGFKEPIVICTAIHFHYAAFAGPLLAGMTGIVLRKSTGARHRMFPVAAWSVMAAPAMLAAGWALGSPLLKLGAALTLAVGLLALVTMTVLAVPHFRCPLAGALLMASGLAVVAGMCLVAVYAGGEFVGRKLITIPQMAVSHGILNGLGFTLCGLVAWTVEQRRSNTHKGALG